MRGHHDVGDPGGIRLLAHGVGRQLEPQRAVDLGTRHGMPPVAFPGQDRVGLVDEGPADLFGLPPGDGDGQVDARATWIALAWCAGITLVCGWWATRMYAAKPAR